MSEAQQAMHVVDYYLWRAMYSDNPYGFRINTNRAMIMLNRSKYLDEREMERDRRENW